MDEGETEEEYDDDDEERGSRTDLGDDDERNEG